MERFVWICARVLFYPTLIWNVLLSRVLNLRNWWDEIDEWVILGAMPFSFDVSRLSDMGVKAVLNLCEEYGGPEEAYRDAGIEELRLPTVDYSSPSLQTVERGIEFIESHVALGHRVYVHCKAGRGRSATVVLCWLLKSKGLNNPKCAMEYLIKRRPHVSKGIHERGVVREFCENIKGYTSNGLSNMPNYGTIPLISNRKE
jgi:atypical dual specificity phosphatase